MQDKDRPQPSAAYLLALYEKLNNFLKYGATTLRPDAVVAFERFLVSYGQNPWTTKPESSLIRVVGNELSHIENVRDLHDLYLVGNFSSIKPSTSVKGLWETSTIWLEAGQTPETVLDEDAKEDGWVLAKPEHLIAFVASRYIPSNLYVFLNGGNELKHMVACSSDLDTTTRIELKLGHKFNPIRSQALVVRKVKI